MSANAKQQDRPDDGADRAQPDAGANDAELDQAIDELRGVLKKDAGTTGRNPDRPETGSGKAGRPGGTNTPAGAIFAGFDDAADDEGPSSDAAASAAPSPDPRLGVIMDIPIDVAIVLGSSRMQVSQLMKLTEGATIALDRRIGEPVEIAVNGRVIGHGEITVLEDDETRFGVRLLDVGNG